MAPRPMTAPLRDAGVRMPGRVGNGPVERRGYVSHGRVAKLFVGQGHGFIRLEDGREAFFHRSDVREGASINDLDIGDPVTFELLEDSVSGARAREVRRRPARPPSKPGAR